MSRFYLLKRRKRYFNSMFMPTTVFHLPTKVSAYSLYIHNEQTKINKTIEIAVVNYAKTSYATIFTTHTLCNERAIFKAFFIFPSNKDFVLQQNRSYIFHFSKRDGKINVHGKARIFHIQTIQTINKTFKQLKPAKNS